MSIKNTLIRVAEKITGRKCAHCFYSRGGHCAHPSDGMFKRCWQSIKRPGYRGKYTEKRTTPSKLTEEEMYQLGKIVDKLQEAAKTARDCGLVEDWEDRTTSGVLEEEYDV